MLRWLAAACAAVFLTSVAPACAQSSREEPIHVAVRILPPFVEQRPDGSMTGFSVELWKAAATRMQRETKFIVAADVRGQLEAVRTGQADVGVGAISITAERNNEFDFSQPILNAGLQILVRSERAGAETTALETLVRLLTSPAVVVWLGIAFLLSIVPAHLVWFFERKHEDGIISSRSYIPGIFQAFLWSVAGLMTQADALPKQINRPGDRDALDLHRRRVCRLLHGPAHRDADRGAISQRDCWAGRLAGQGRRHHHWQHIGEIPEGQRRGRREDFREGR
jgi:polar amino acid transport system substrate-binding protein